MDEKKRSLFLGIGVVVLIFGLLFTFTRPDDEITSPSTPSPTPASDERITTCTSLGGKWLEEYNECEGMPADTCIELGGEYNECGSACRHAEDPITPCTLQCIQFCSFN